MYECWEKYLHTTKEYEWIGFVNYRTWPHEFSSPYKYKCVDCGESYNNRKTACCRRGSIKFRLVRLRLLSSLGSDIVYVYFLLFVDISSLLWMKFISFHLLSLRLEFTWYFQIVASLPTKWHLSLPKRGVSTGKSGRDAGKTNFFFFALFLEGFHFSNFFIRLSKV